MQRVVTPSTRNSWTSAEKKGSIGREQEGLLEAPQTVDYETFDTSLSDIAQDAMGELVEKLIGGRLPEDFTCPASSFSTSDG